MCIHVHVCDVGCSDAQGDAAEQVPLHPDGVVNRADQHPLHAARLPGAEGLVPVRVALGGHGGHVLLLPHASYPLRILPRSLQARSLQYHSSSIPPWYTYPS